MRTQPWVTWAISCFMGLLPLIAWLLAHQLAGGRGIVGPDATRELLFFSLSTASTALLNLAEKARPGWPQLWSFCGQFLTIVPALLYGEFLIGEALHAAMHVRFAYNSAIGLAVGAVAYSVLIEGLIHRRSPS
jgi:hypothetical protein